MTTFDVAGRMEAFSVGTAFSGMDTIKWALGDLGKSAKNYKHAFSIEKSAACRCFIKQNVKVPKKKVYADIHDVDESRLPTVDIYVAGFPCQAFSKAGKRQGANDEKGRGRLFDKCLKYLKEKTPRCFMLENVSSLATDKKFEKYFRSIMRRLRTLHDGIYTIHYEVLDTQDHGLPHHRERLYIIGIRSDLPGPLPKFKFPKPILGADLEELLDMTDTRHQLNVPRSPTGIRNLAKAVRNMIEKGVNPFDNVIVVDVGGGPSRKALWRQGAFPCITHARGTSRGYWLTKLNRPVKVQELLRVQGIGPSEIKTDGISDPQLGGMATNLHSRGDNGR